MAYSLGTDTPALDKLGIDIARGSVRGFSSVHKFGAATVGTSFVPVARGSVWQTPQVAGATTLRIKASGDANDTAAGTGAREVCLQGLDETGALVEECVATAGASASSATTTTFIRLFRAWVSESGTYASQSAPSHADDIVIENGAGGTDWATLSATGFARGQSEIGCYTVPRGYQAYVKGFVVSSDASKSTDFIFYQRRNIL